MFVNLSIKQKIFLGYISMILLTLIVGAYAIWSLQEVNEVTRAITFNDLSSGEKLSKLYDSIQAQDLYEKRFLTLHHQEAENMFLNKSREFKSLAVELGQTAPTLGKILESVSSSHKNYNLLFMKEASLIKAGKFDEAEKISQGELKTTFNKIQFYLRDMDVKIVDLQNYHINRSNSLSQEALMITIMLSIVSVVFGILFATLITTHLTKAIERLKQAADSIRSGNFDNLPEIKGADELADLAISFKEMSVRLKELETMNLDANPLTKLPGNLAIEKELLTRLNETNKFSFCLIDLDNFKAYSDRYGYSKGSDILKWLGDMLQKVINDYGGPDDFLGHIGGDDFVIICSPERVQKICSKIIEEFDKGIFDHYEPEDLKKGFIISVDRNDKPAIFGIMTVSIAVVNTDRTLVREPKEIATKIAELKQYAKTFAKSLYIMDRRRLR